MVRILLSAIVFFSASSIALAKDPTRPIFSQTKATKPAKVKSTGSKQPLKAIITRNNKRYAIIDGERYQAGDHYRGNKIVRIDQARVLLSSRTGKFQLTLIPKIKK